ncbi:hypothetical protein P4H09_24100 [Bacillus cereus]|nr:hypothetical protein [Bacillus cereus]
MKRRKRNMLKMNARGPFLNSFAGGGKLKNTSIQFTQQKINWRNYLQKDELEPRVGVYAIVDDNNEIIYIGSTIREGGIRERHATRGHEKNGLFELFNARKMILYFESENDPANILLLERYIICQYDPILNKDIKMGSLYDNQTYDKLILKLNEMCDFYELQYKKTLDGKPIQDIIFEVIQDKLMSVRNHKEIFEGKYNKAEKELKKAKYIVEFKKEEFNNKNKIYKDLIDETVPKVNELYTHYLLDKKRLEESSGD